MQKILTEEQKMQIYDSLAKSYLELLEKGLIGRIERKILSRKILDYIEPAKSYEEVIAFINSLISIYPAFSKALVQVKGEVNKMHEKQVIGQLQKMIQTV